MLLGSNNSFSITSIKASKLLSSVSFDLYETGVFFFLFGGCKGKSLLFMVTFCSLASMDEIWFFVRYLVDLRIYQNLGVSGTNSHLLGIKALN